MKNKFTHLHVHTEYSLLDGLSNITDMLEHVKENGMDSVAVTDHGVMYGIIEFYKKAKKVGIKPILGMEGYITNVDHTKKPQRGKFKNYHLLLLAKNKKGYRNLMRLTSIAHLEGYYYRPRVDRETLKKHSEGLICTSACAQGEVAQALINDNFKKAKKTVEWYMDVFGKDYYLEIQRHEYDKFLDDIENDQIKSEILTMSENEKKINDGVISLSRSLGVPLIATNDTHYIKKEDAKAQDALVCIATAKNVSDIKRLRFIDAPSFYMKTPTEMKDLFPDVPDAIENTTKIVDKCSIKIVLDKWFFPEYPLANGLTPDEEMEKLVWEGIEKKFKKVTKKIKERVNYEMDIIKKKGYSTYFLIVADMANFAYKNGIITNTRGSAAGSLVSYAMGIISINPLDYDLPFERFLTPWRPSPPDIDFDIADDRREEIISWITKKYGKEKVAQICTFGRMLAKASVRDVARVLGYPYSTGDRIAKAIPFGSQGFPMTIDKALDVSADLKEMYTSDEDAKKVIDLARQIEGNARHISVHAAGLVISPDEITNHSPIQLDPEGKKVITQYDMDALDPNVSPGEAVGLLKFDLLGLRNLSILGSSIKILKATQSVDIDIQNIPLDDRKTFEMLSRGDTMGVFQLSGSGITRYLKELKPTKIEDLMAMVALYRPGPMSQIPEYIKRKKDPDRVSYFDPRMKEYLKKSYGLIVYQDDVFMTAIKIAGYTWEEADKFRKAVGKKIPKEMERQKEKFINGAVKNGLSKKEGEDLFKLIEPFSGYGFNKAHAASYGMLAYQTAYMKANYPVEFMCALLSAESHDKDKVSTAIHECKRIGIKVLPPDINESKTNFTIVEHEDSLEGQAIRFGLGAIKNVGEAAIDAIVSARKEGAFLSFADFLSRVDSRKVNKRVLESLIKVGALSNFGKRAALLSSMENIRSRVSKPSGNDNQQGLFSKDELKKGMKSSHLKINTQVEEFSDEKLQTLERQLLGFSLSSKPVGDLIEDINPSATHKIFEISPRENIDQTIKIAAVVSDVRIIVTKRTGQEMAFIRVEDDTGSMELVVFPKIFEKTKTSWIDNNPLLITGRVDNRNESASLIVEKIKTKDSLKEDPDRLYIRIPKSADVASLKKLRLLLSEHHGDQNVSLMFEENNKKIDLDFKVSWSKKLAQKINDILQG